MINFKSFTEREYNKDNDATSKNFGWVRNIMGVPQLATFNTKSDTTGETLIVIPSMHPGRISYGGVVMDKLTRIFVLASGIAWSAATIALQQDQDEPTLPRGKKINNIFEALNAKLGPDTEFGKTLTRAKEEYILAASAWQQGHLTKARGIPIMKPPRGLLQGRLRRNALRPPPAERTKLSRASAMHSKSPSKRWLGTDSLVIRTFVTSFHGRKAMVRSGRFRSLCCPRRSSHPVRRTSCFFASKFCGTNSRNRY
jgi:hypothetical protein